MRIALLLAILPAFNSGPARAWEFSPDPVCTLTHQAQDAEITITYDAALPEYALFVTLRDGTWPDAPSFAMEFFGPRALAIGTDRHSASGASLTVRDRGFGNVLDGLEFNTTAVAASGGRSVQIALDAAAPAVQAFRACPSDMPATS